MNHKNYHFKDKIMQVSTIVQTTGFRSLPEETNNKVAPFLGAVLQLMRTEYWEADLFIGDPNAKKITFEDYGRTCRMPFLGGKRSIYIKIDGSEKTPEQWKEAGYPEYPVMTLMLPDEY